MKRLIITIVAVIAPSLCQYAFHAGVRPDVTFGENNDRFDVTNLIRRQKHHFKANLDSQSEEYRRRYKSEPKDLPNTERRRGILKKRIKNKLEDHVNYLANNIIAKIRGMRRREDSFDYHDNMNSEGGDVNTFNTNLRALEDAPVLEDELEDKSTRRLYHLQNIVNKLHGTYQTSRKVLDPEKEILFHYGFPVDMKIEGFLQTPS